MANKKQYSISLEQETWDKVKEIADQKFTSMSAIVRQAIAEKIEREKEEK